MRLLQTLAVLLCLLPLSCKTTPDPGEEPPEAAADPDDESTKSTPKPAEADEDELHEPRRGPGRRGPGSRRPGKLIELSTVTERVEVAAGNTAMLTGLRIGLAPHVSSLAPVFVELRPDYTVAGTQIPDDIGLATDAKIIELGGTPEQVIVGARVTYGTVGRLPNKLVGLRLMLQTLDAKGGLLPEVISSDKIDVCVGEQAAKCSDVQPEQFLRVPKGHYVADLGLQLHLLKRTKDGVRVSHLSELELEVAPLPTYAAP